MSVRFGFTAVAVVLLLAGCGQGDPSAGEEPSPGPSVSGSVSATESAGPTPTPPPGMPPIRDMPQIRYPRDPEEGVAPGPVRSYEDYDVDRVRPFASLGMYFGYEGPCYSQLQWDRGIVVLDKTIGIERREVWVPDLLARNDTLERVGVNSAAAGPPPDEHEVKLRAATLVAAWADGLHHSRRRPRPWLTSSSQVPLAHEKQPSRSTTAAALYSTSMGRPTSAPTAGR